MEGLSTNTAWDNYDESMYHDTQDICMQNEDPVATLQTEPTTKHTNNPTCSTADTSPSSPTDATHPISVSKKKKRSLGITTLELESVRNKLQIS